MSKCHYGFDCGWKDCPTHGEATRIEHDKIWRQSPLEDALAGLARWKFEAEELRRQLAESKAAETRRVDATVQYRNLAISLGAKPEQMVDRYDRGLCECGLNAADDLGAYPDAWEEVEQLENQRDEALAKLAATQHELERWRHGQQIEGDYVCPDSLRLTEAKRLLASIRDDKPGYYRAKKHLQAIDAFLSNQPAHQSTLAPPDSATAESQAARPSPVGSPGGEDNGGLGANPAAKVEPATCKALGGSACCCDVCGPCRDCTEPKPARPKPRTGKPDPLAFYGPGLVEPKAPELCWICYRQESEHTKNPRKCNHFYSSAKPPTSEPFVDPRPDPGTNKQATARAHEIAAKWGPLPLVSSGKPSWLDERLVALEVVAKAVGVLRHQDVEVRGDGSLIDLWVAYDNLDALEAKP